MLPAFEMIHVFYLALAIILEIAANVLLKYSSGFKHKTLFITAILCVLGSFTSLSFAIQGIHLSFAYAIWGGFGLIATALSGVLLFKEYLKPAGWIGIISILIGMSLIKFA